MSNSIVKVGSFKSNPNSKNLDRPRSESNIERTHCISQGIGAGGNGDSRMQFQSKRIEDLWGKGK